MPMTDSTRRHDLLKAFAEPRCPVCQLVLRDNEQDMFNLYQDRINKVETHVAFRAGRGLCNAHAWQMAQAKGSAISVAVMYESTVFELLKHADTIQPEGSRLISRLLGKSADGAQAAETLEARGECLLCESMTKNEDSYLQIIVDNIGEEALRTAYTESIGGLCLPHARAVLRKLSRQADVEWLLAVQIGKWRTLQDDLNKFIDNNEQNIPHWQMGAEGNSWQRAVRYMSGELGVFGLRR